MFESGLNIHGDNILHLVAGNFAGLVLTKLNRICTLDLPSSININPKQPKALLYTSRLWDNAYCYDKVPFRSVNQAPVVFVSYHITIVSCGHTFYCMHSFVFMNIVTLKYAFHYLGAIR